MLILGGTLAPLQMLKLNVSLHALYLQFGTIITLKNCIFAVRIRFQRQVVGLQGVKVWVQTGFGL